MKKIEWNEALNYLDSDLIEKHLEQKERLRQKKQKTKRTWLRFGAIAACFCFVFAIGVIVTPMLQNKPNTDDLEDELVNYENMQDVEQVIGSDNLISNIVVDNFDFSEYMLWYHNGKNEAPTLLECNLSLGSFKDQNKMKSVNIYCSFPQFRGEMSNIDHFLPSSVLPPDFPDKGETDTVVPPTLLTTTIDGVEVFYYQYELGSSDLFGGLGKFEVNNHLYIVKTSSADNENFLFEVISEMLAQD